MCIGNRKAIVNPENTPKSDAAKSLTHLWHQFNKKKRLTGHDLLVKSVAECCL
jgi:hypothetical protein